MMDINYGVVQPIKRYDISCDFDMGVNMMWREDGDYVLYADWIELKEAYELLAAEHEGPEI